MKLKPFFSISALLAIIIFLAASCHNTTDESTGWKYEDGYVPNEASAIKIAEIVWLNVYGEEIYGEKPYSARLKDSKIWIVQGTRISGGYALGGVAYIEIQKSDGKILKVIHGK